MEIRVKQIPVGVGDRVLLKRRGVRTEGKEKKAGEQDRAGVCP